MGLFKQLFDDATSSIKDAMEQKKMKSKKASIKGNKSFKTT